MRKSGYGFTADGKVTKNCPNNYCSEGFPFVRPFAPVQGSPPMGGNSPDIPQTIEQFEEMRKRVLYRTK